MLESTDKSLVLISHEISSDLFIIIYMMYEEIQKFWNRYD